jgi:hypothetical protein
MAEIKLKKNCIWRHGPYKTIKIIEHKYDGKFKMPVSMKDCKEIEWSNGGGYIVKRIFIIQQCLTCGKMIITDSSSCAR